MITVYNPAMRVSVPAPRGWRTELGKQAGFDMQNFTGPALDDPDQPGVVVQVLAGPRPPEASLERLAETYIQSKRILSEEPYDFLGAPARLWRFSSQDGAENYELMLAPVEARLYGIYVRGEAKTLQAYGEWIRGMRQGLGVEEPRFWTAYEKPEFGLRLRHPPSWKLTPSVSQPGKAFFAGFRSPPLASDEGGATLHATLEVTVAETAPDMTLERFYAQRVEMLGDNYRLVDHETERQGAAICDLYAIETQLANYLEKTYYFVEGGRSYVFKFNVPNPIFHQIETWIADIAGTFLSPKEPSAGN